VFVLATGVGTVVKGLKGVILERAFGVDGSYQ